MKKILLAVLLSGFSFSSFAIDWTIIERVDEFTDKKDCSVASTNFYGNDGASLVIYTASKGAIGYVNQSFLAGYKLRYRVDKESALTFEGDQVKIYYIKGDNYNNLINSLSNGENLLFEVHGKGFSNENAKSKISLENFKEVYEKALKCE